MELIDSHGRKINYLRLSVTDRCNMRCTYCMPPDGIQKVSHDQILRWEDLLRIARAAVHIGIEKIRITGGEPLVRRGIIPFLQQISSIPDLKHLALTTNGLLLPEMAADLKHAGVQRLNISLDSLQPARFHEITRGGDLKKVLAGIVAAETAGFPPVKLNIVVMRGVNDEELCDFASMTLKSAYAIRFIEYMPSLRLPGWQEKVMPGAEIIARLTDRYELIPIDKGPYSGPSRDFRIAGAAGSIGIITAVSGHFCSDCNRVRVTAKGTAKGCLFSGEQLDLRPLLASADQEPLEHALKQLVAIKPERHGLSEQSADHEPFVMASIGG